MKTVTRRGIGQLCALFASTFVTSTLVSGCLSPTLPPFPPPAEPQTMTYEAPGQLRLTGIVTREQATVYAVNTETGDIGGKQVRDGEYSFLVTASPGQELELYYQIGNDFSESTFLKAPEYEGALLPDTSIPDASNIDASTGDAGPSE